MKKTLILLTNAFPYGNGEPYLETEVNYYDVFDKIYICSLQIGREQLKKKRNLPSNKFTVIPVRFAAKLIYILYGFVALTDKELYKEIGRLIKQRRLSLKRIVKLFIYVSRSHYEAKGILKYFKNTKLYNSKEEGVIYSYRFEYQPYVGLLIQKHLPRFNIVARGHRYDLYEEKNNVSYIPMRELLMEKLDKVITVSNDGRNYLTRKYPAFRNKIIVSRLGTQDYGIRSTQCPNGEINIVSCSNVVPVKRIDMIVKSLQQIKGVKVHWTHYGDGEILQKMKSNCEKSFSEKGANITYDFRGQTDNKSILEDYKKKPYHLFINVSSSEGIPVSIMEAMSYGIPCIATDVGGTNEIVINGTNGILLREGFSPEELGNYISMFAKMDDREYQVFRENARFEWQEKYNANKNYREFVDFLYNLTNID